MNKTEIINEFIQVKETDTSINILVQVIMWDGHTPSSKWVIAKKLPISIKDNAIEEEVSELIENTKYFGLCSECGERNPNGWMHDNNICQSCAERNHGVVY